MSEWLLIIGMALLTFLPRYLPFGLAGKVVIPPLLERALSFVPIAVLTVIIIQTAFIREGEIAINVENHYLVATLVAFVVALITRQLYLTIFFGLISFAAMKYFI
ncbi:MAG TPA: AzlD domain-containing protein [Leucothrix sp.]|nr:AzlD domain-containing protein [Leucothrix sp.]